ncbi:MAG: type I-U CRISPR-associated helicase/endonuclease Cas3 [Actinomycetales bacterium]
MILTSADFPDFVAEVHGHRPFPWQSDLVGRVLNGGGWPDLLDVPTGLGKTSVLDVAVFVAAATAGDPGPRRLGRRRCFFVVDRRIVVDEAFDHATRLAEALEVAEGGRGVLGAVAGRLRSFAPHAGGPVLPVARMRGGTTWAASWVDRPDQPAVVVGTVDQVGSRLLFRGYGVSERRRPLDAALVGTDALLIVDEAHLAAALTTTVDATRARDTPRVGLPGLDVVRMTATAEPGPRTYSLDVDAHRGHEEAWRRLTANKRLTTVETDVRTCPRVMATLAVDHATESATGHDWAPTVLVVCNTVARARAVHELIVQDTTAGRARTAHPAVDCELLIGRTRPLDRPGLQDRVLDRFGVDRGPGSRPAILVATQTVEVGVNLDVDALVTESAPWDSLVQRMGRLNRLGRHSIRRPSAPPPTAVVVHDGQADGPVYGAVRDASWEALVSLTTPVSAGRAEIRRTNGHEGLDVSPLACRELSRTVLREASMRPRDVPVLLTPTLDAWAQTAPVPEPDPQVAPFLHGFEAPRPAVLVAWRLGLVTTDDLDDPFAEDDEQPDAEVAAGVAGVLLDAVPVRSPERVEVPFAAVRAWMAGEPPAGVADVDTALDADERAGSKREPFRVLAWRSRADGTSTWEWITHRELRPGDQIVVPAERGGLDQYGWNPVSGEPVPDVGDQASFGSRGRPVLRLDEHLGQRLRLPDDQWPALSGAVRRIRTGDDETDALAQVIREVLADCSADETVPSGIRSWWREQVLPWLDAVRLIPVEHLAAHVVAGEPGQPVSWLLSGPRPRGPQSGAGEIGRDDDSEAGTSVGSQPVTLTRHHTAVRRRATDIATALGLPAHLVAAVADAAGWHDLGKVEDRFQAMLHGGDRMEALLAEEPLAKSGMDPDDRTSWRQATRSSGLPRGARHEAWSAALVLAYLVDRQQASGPDPDLVVHLVASHHGHARPLLPLVVDLAPRPVTTTIQDVEVSVDSAATVDLDQPARFARLNQRYGRWGLALLESTVRCADMTVSAEGS